MTILLISFFQFSSVSAATLSDADILKSINQIETNTTFNGYGQCYGFAKETFANLFALNIADINWDYTNGSTTSKYLYLVNKTQSQDELSALLSMAKAGDVLCWGGGAVNPHSMIFIGKDDENAEITVLDANWGDNNIIKNHTISYKQLSEQINYGSIMSLFRYTPAIISLSSETANLYLGASGEVNSTQLICTTVSANYPTPVWISSDPSIAAVDQNGIVTAAGIGEAIITCQIGNHSAQCIVTVNSYELSATRVEYKRLSLVGLKFLQLNINSLEMPSFSTDVIWRSSNPKLAMVNSKGLVTIQSNNVYGTETAVITATTNINNKTAVLICTIIVN